MYVSEYYAGITEQLKLDPSFRRISQLITFTMTNDSMKKDYEAQAAALRTRIEKVCMSVLFLWLVVCLNMRGSGCEGMKDKGGGGGREREEASKETEVGMDAFVCVKQAGKEKWKLGVKGQAQNRHTLTHSLTHSLTPSLTHTHTHTHTHSFTDSHTHTLSLACTCIVLALLIRRKTL